jgi:hypothetical protein
MPPGLARRAAAVGLALALAAAGRADAPAADPADRARRLAHLLDELAADPALTPDQRATVARLAEGVRDLDRLAGTAAAVAQQPAGTIDGQLEQLAEVAAQVRRAVGAAGPDPPPTDARRAALLAEVARLAQELAAEPGPAPAAVPGPRRTDGWYAAVGLRGLFTAHDRFAAIDAQKELSRGRAAVLGAGGDAATAAVPAAAWLVRASPARQVSDARITPDVLMGYRWPDSPRSVAFEYRAVRADFHARGPAMDLLPSVADDFRYRSNLFDLTYRYLFGGRDRGWELEPSVGVAVGAVEESETLTRRSVPALPYGEYGWAGDMSIDYRSGFVGAGPSAGLGAAWHATPRLTAVGRADAQVLFGGLDERYGASDDLGRPIPTALRNDPSADQTILVSRVLVGGAWRPRRWDWLEMRCGYTAEWWQGLGEPDDHPWYPSGKWNVISHGLFSECRFGF